jgi:hypothetical protein
MSGVTSALAAGFLVARFLAVRTRCPWKSISTRGKWKCDWSCRRRWPQRMQSDEDKIFGDSDNYQAHEHII